LPSIGERWLGACFGHQAMPAEIIRFSDYERKSRNADAVERDPADTAIIIVLPVIRIERYDFDEFPRCCSYVAPT
jgi:hypothetical protein